MLLILPFYPGDQEAAIRLGGWIGELGGCKGHELLLVRDIRSPDLTNYFKDHFDRVTTELVRDDAWNKWPDSANNMFRKGAKYVEFQRTDIKYFLWLEPDVVPISPDWVNKIEAEFKEGVKTGKRFMGDLVQVENVPTHMSGIGVYPSPLSQFAGPAYLAQDIAWDCYASNEILPKAHFTSLIKHNWKHPKFETVDEVNNLLTRHPQMVLFHASKDGSLIELLRQKKALPANGAQGEPATEVYRYSSHETREQRPLVTDIFIKTYPQDYEWLKYCLRSIAKFAKGFRDVHVVSSGEGLTKLFNEIDVPMRTPLFVFRPEYLDDGYLSQQIFKVYADEYSNADYILHMDSDTMFTMPVNPQTFFKYGKGRTVGTGVRYDLLPIWMMTPIRTMDHTPWAQVIKRFMGEEPEFEFMRRFPFVMPRWFYASFREYIRDAHQRSAEAYIKQQPVHNWSEFNCMGAFAHKFHRDKFHWIDTSKDEWPVLTVEQLWSHGGLTDEIRDRREKILNLNAVPVPADVAESNHTSVKGEERNPADHDNVNDSISGEARESIAVLTGKGSRGGVQTFPEQARFHADALATLADTPYHRMKVRSALKEVKLIR